MFLILITDLNQVNPILKIKFSSTAGAALAAWMSVKLFLMLFEEYAL